MTLKSNIKLPDMKVADFICVETFTNSHIVRICAFPSPFRVGSLIFRCVQRVVRSVVEFIFLKSSVITNGLKRISIDLLGRDEDYR